MDVIDLALELFKAQPVLRHNQCARVGSSCQYLDVDFRIHLWVSFYLSTPEIVSKCFVHCVLSRDPSLGNFGEKGGRKAHFLPENGQSQHWLKRNIGTQRLIVERALNKNLLENFNLQTACVHN